MKIIIFLKFNLALLLSTLMMQGVYAEKLTVYTYDSFASEWGPGPLLKSQFEQQCRCEINYVVLGDALAMLGRLKLEGQDSPADVVVGLDINTLELAKKTGLFAKHDLDLTALTLPLDWTDETFVPFDFGYFAFVYNSDVVENPPASFDQLIENKANYKYIIQDPRSSTPGLGLLLWVKHLYGNNAAQVWRRLSPSILTITPGWSEAYGLFLEGEAELVLSYTTSPAYHMIAEEKYNYKAAEFTQGHYIQVETAAFLKQSKYPALAKDFLQYLVSESAQKAIVTGNWMYPSALSKDKLPLEFSNLVQPQATLLIPSEKVAASKNRWVDEFINAMSQ